MVTSKMRIPNYNAALTTFPKSKEISTDRDLVVNINVRLGLSRNPAFGSKIKDHLTS